MSQHILWRISVLVSLFGLGVICMMWYIAHSTYQPNPETLTSSETVTTFLNRHQPTSHVPLSEKPVYVPTGFFVQSLRFMSKVDVQVKGYIWQKYPLNMAEPISQNFILPEVVEAADTFTQTEMYREKQENHEVIGWYFEGIFRHQFDYHKYPLDHKTVMIRLWPKDFTRNVIFTPDFDAYPKNVRNQLGLENDIVLQGWELDETFFEYHMNDFQTDFGIGQLSGLHERPELSFNIVITRNFKNAFIVHLMPLVVVLIMLFTLLSSIYKDPQKKEIFGVNVQGIIGSCSSLFFIVMLCHIHLRNSSLGSEVVYVEYFYFLSYFVLLVVAINGFVYLSGKLPHWKWIHCNDNLIIKVLFWPFISVTAALFTVVVLFP
jgi:hypothetical protein